MGSMIDISNRRCRFTADIFQPKRSKTLKPQKSAIPAAENANYPLISITCLAALIAPWSREPQLRRGDHRVEGNLATDTEHRQIKCQNNDVEAEHGKLKKLIGPVPGFKTVPTTYATIKRFEVMRALRKDQAAAFNLTRDHLARPA